MQSALLNALYTQIVLHGGMFTALSYLRSNINKLSYSFAKSLSKEIFFLVFPPADKDTVFAGRIPLFL